MSSLVVALCYGSAMVISLALLWYFGAQSWYWHVLSFCGASVIGLTPLPEAWNSPAMTLAIGWVFTLLFIWAIFGPIFALSHHQPHFGSRSH
jgi:hypothetical protein